MNVAMRRPMSLDEFLAWEARQELRYEFDGLRPVAMTGSTNEHSLIQANVIAALSSRLRGGPCRVHGSHIKLVVAGRVRYPDAFVVCAPVPRGATLIADPVVVFKILSDSSAADDLVTKNAEYRATQSIQRYVVLQQSRMGATVFNRSGDLWAAGPIEGEDVQLEMPEIGISVPLAEVYLNVPLGDVPFGDATPGAANTELL